MDGGLYSSSVFTGGATAGFETGFGAGLLTGLVFSLLVDDREEFELFAANICLVTVCFLPESAAGAGLLGTTAATADLLGAAAATAGLLGAAAATAGLLGATAVAGLLGAAAATTDLLGATAVAGLLGAAASVAGLLGAAAEDTLSSSLLDDKELSANICLVTEGFAAANVTLRCTIGSCLVVCKTSRGGII